MSRLPGPAVARPVAAPLLATVLALAPALAGCDASGGGSGPADAGQAEGEADAGLAEPAAVELRDGVQAAPGTRVLGDGAGTTESGWYAALDLADAPPREVAEFYRAHLGELGFAVESGTGPLTVVATRPEGAAEPVAAQPGAAQGDQEQADPMQPGGAGSATTRVRVDVVPRSGEVPGFVRVVAG